MARARHRAARLAPRLAPRLARAAALIVMAALPALALAQQLPGITSMKGPGGGQTWSLSIELLVLLTFLSFVPAALLAMTGFTRILIVLGLLRSALGTQSTPPNQVLVGLSLFLTLFVMSPVFDKAYQDAYVPYSNGKLTPELLAKVSTDLAAITE